MGMSIPILGVAILMVASLKTIMVSPDYADYGLIQDTLHLDIY